MHPSPLHMNVDWSSVFDSTRIPFVGYPFLWSLDSKQPQVPPSNGRVYARVNRAREKSTPSPQESQAISQSTPILPWCSVLWNASRGWVWYCCTKSVKSIIKWFLRRDALYLYAVFRARVHSLCSISRIPRQDNIYIVYIHNTSSRHKKKTLINIIHRCTYTKYTGSFFPRQQHFSIYRYLSLFYGRQIIVVELLFWCIFLSSLTSGPLPNFWLISEEVSYNPKTGIILGAVNRPRTRAYI